jgi:hypothetical protein
MTVWDEDSGKTLRVSNRQLESTAPVKMPPRSAGIMSSFGSNNKSRGDREISAYVQKLERQKSEPKQQIDLLSKLRAVLQHRVQQQKANPELGALLGPPVVEVMRQNPANEELIEESTCILYLLSILDPSFKKGVARLFKAMEDHRENVAIQRAACAAIR